MALFGTKEEPKQQFFDTISGEELTAIIREMGFTPELGKDSQGDPIIKLQIEGMRTGVFFYGTKDGNGRARSLSFYLGFSDKCPIEKINTWNAKKRFAKAYVDENGTSFNFDVDLDGGVRREYFTEILKRWRGLVGEFASFLRT